MGGDPVPGYGSGDLTGKFAACVRAVLHHQGSGDRSRACPDQADPGGARRAHRARQRAGEGNDRPPPAPRGSADRMSKGQILVGDDEGAQREILRTILTSEGYRVETADSGAEALQKSGRTRFDLVLTDLRMPGGDGLSLVGQLTREDPPTLVILMTAYGSRDSAEQALKQGAFDYLTKPLERDELLLTVGRAFERMRLIHENRLLRQQLEERFRVVGIVGSHYPMQEVFEKLHKISNSNSTVLITRS